MKPGRELDARVCRLLGWEPKRMADCQVLQNWDEWPKVSTDSNAMLRAIDAMRERGWYYSISDEGLTWLDGACPHFCRFHKGAESFRREGETPHYAVALAILSALEPEGE